MKFAQLSTTRPLVKLVGEIEHADFAEAIAQIRADARFVADGDTPELIVIAQSRPGAISERVVRSLRSSAPLAGVVGLLGSWCEGEARTGRPWPDVTRLYWYQFTTWWHLQMKRRSAGLCPDWARPGNFEFQKSASRSLKKASPGVVTLRTFQREMAEALATVLRNFGYSTVWHGTRSADFTVRGMLAGVWDGGQLDDREAEDLSGFCRSLSRETAPVVVLLDYPRRDSFERALRCGAAAVLGKPWRNDEMIAAMEMAVAQRDTRRAA